MAKDGTNRGGARPGAGRKPKALKEKLDAGNPGKRPLTKLDIPENIEGVDMPKPGEYLSGLQRDGKPLGADEIYNKVCRWLTKLGCEKLVNPTLIEQYAMSVARWVQCEEAISRLGFLGKHSTTGQPCQSPFVHMSQSYMKQSNLLWATIQQIVKENCSVDVTGSNPENDMMEMLLRSRGK
ncbi:MAG: P27 family phage terminase small subunit [Ruminococcus sp.]|nr:P27 family phage terminase small subunit [Ruminococcus sp.]